MLTICNIFSLENIYVLPPKVIFHISFSTYHSTGNTEDTNMHKYLHTKPNSDLSTKQVIVCGQGRESCMPPSYPLRNSPYLWRKQVHTGCGPVSKEAQRQKTLGWVVELPAQAFSGRMAELGRRGKVGTSKCLWEPSFLLPVLWFPIHASLLQGLPLPPRVTNQIWIQVLRAKGSYFRSSYLPVSDLFHFLCFFFFF